MLKKFLKFSLFMIITIVLLFVVSRVLLRTLHDSNNREFNHMDFYDIKENTVDVLFVGSSLSYCSYIPSKLYEEYGISSYNLSTSNQSMLACYLWAKEAYKYQKYKVLVVEAGSLLNSHGDVTNDIRSLSTMKLSGNYFELCKTYKRAAYKVVFPVFEFHSSWDKLRMEQLKSQVNEETEYMRGYVPIFTSAGEENTVEIIDESNDEIGYLKFPYADKIVEFCRDNSIELIFIKSPQARADTNYWDAPMHNRAKLYLKENNIPFYDFNTVEDAGMAGIIRSEDVAEDGRHTNYYGALKMTRFVGNLLTKEYDIDFSNSEYDNSLVTRFNDYTGQYLEK